MAEMEELEEQLADSLRWAVEGLIRWALVVFVRPGAGSHRPMTRAGQALPGAERQGARAWADPLGGAAL